MRNFQLDTLELQKLSLAEKIKEYFSSIKELEGFHFYRISSKNKKEVQTDIFLNAYVQYENNLYVWTKNGVSSCNESETDNIKLLKQFSDINFSIDYYLEQNGTTIYFEELRKNLIGGYNKMIFDEDTIKFERATLIQDCEFFIGRRTLAKIDSMKLNSLLDNKSMRSIFLKI